MAIKIASYGFGFKDDYSMREKKTHLYNQSMANLQQLFAKAVKNPNPFYSGRLQKLIEMPYEKTRDKFTQMYKSFRKRADKVLYGVDL